MWQIMIKAQIRDVGGDALTNNGFKPQKMENFVSIYSKFE
jgi:hypothetical protein